MVDDFDSMEYIVGSSKTGCISFSSTSADLDATDAEGLGFGIFLLLSVWFNEVPEIFKPWCKFFLLGAPKAGLEVHFRGCRTKD